MISLPIDGSWQPTLLDLGFDAVEQAVLLSLPYGVRTVPFPRGPVRLRLRLLQALPGNGTWHVQGVHFTEADVEALRSGQPISPSVDAFDLAWVNPQVGDLFERVISPKSRYLRLDLTFPGEAVSGELRALGLSLRGPSSLRLGPPPNLRPR